MWPALNTRYGLTAIEKHFDKKHYSNLYKYNIPMADIFPQRFTPLIFLILFFIYGCKQNIEISYSRTDTPSTAAVYKVIGPGGGGGIFKPVISPFNENLVMVHCDMTGAYISHDGGLSWKIKNLWNVSDDYVFDPLDSGIIYLATRGFSHSEDRGSGISMLLKSEDQGNKWKIIYPDINKIKLQTDHLQNTSLMPSQLIDGAIDGNIDKIAVDPSNNKKIYLGLSRLKNYMAPGAGEFVKNEVMILVSSNGGISWKNYKNIPGQTVKLIIPGHPINQPGKVIVITESSIVLIDENSSKVKVYALPVDNLITAAGGKSGNNFLIYIQAKYEEENNSGGMYLSRDLGRTWTQINKGLFSGISRDHSPSFNEGLAVCETRAKIAYLSVTNPVSKSDGTTTEIYSIYKTTDAGNSWKPVLLSSSPDGYITKNFKGSWMEQSYDPGWGGSPINLGVAPRNPDICYAGDNGRCYKTTDGGKSWEQVYSKNLPDGSYTTRGLDVTTCYGVHFDPFNPEHLFICYTDIGLFHSFNGGKSWFHSITGVPRDWQNTCYDLAFDPQVSGKIWSVWATAHDLPREKMFGDEGFGDYNGGVVVSTDNGHTWKKCNHGLSENSICTNILIDLTSPVESRMLYVSVFDKGIYKTTEDGNSWKQANTGLGKNLFAWELRQNSRGRLFALFSRGKRNGQTVDGEIYFSDDKSKTWHLLPLPDRVNGPHDLLIDPVDPEVMYVSCWPRSVNGIDSRGGVIKTGDGGKTWKQVFDERVRVNSAGIDPENQNIIYINTFQNAAYRSDDAGASWQRIEGYRFKWGQRAIPDIHHPGMLYLTTYGGSVFYGPAKGIPGASDDIVNMPEKWW